MVKKSFYRISIVGNFFKFWSKCEGSKNHRCCRNFCQPKKIVFLLNQIQSTFSISEFFFSRLLLCKIIWLVVYPHFAVIFHFFVKISTFCGLQIFLHKSTQNQQILKKIIKFEKFDKNRCLFIPQHQL